MPGYFRISTLAFSSPELCPVSDKAFRLWISAGCWCVQYSRTWVPKHVLRVLGGGNVRAANQLADAGLWLADTVEGKTGWWFLENRLWEGSSGGTRETIPATLRKAVLDRDGNACLHCGTPEGLQMDHIFPWSRGGATSYDNLQTLCGPCNRAKGARI